ncbi:MAG: transaldolase family protein [Nitrospinae bacterium]|nr:transaldolase family protein [Nitrospinota bacterium]
MDIASQRLENVVHEIAFQRVERGDLSSSHPSNELLSRLKSIGTELWIDTGDLELARSIWKRELTALTTNNTLANQVVQSGVMDETIKDAIARIQAAAGDLSEEELVMEIGFVVNCKIALRLVEAFRVHVSVELHPSVSRDIDRTLYYARRYYKVCPDYFFIKIPLTPEGLIAVRKLRRENIPINFTLGFSARQNYLAARLSNPNYANVFLGRLNAVVADNSLGSGNFVGEKATLAAQQAISEARKKHASVTTRLIGASVRNGDQVACLAGLDVLTIPPAAMKQFLESRRSPSDVVDNAALDLKPDINTGNRLSSRFPKLWELPSPVKTFVDELLAHDRLERMNGGDLAEFCEKRGMDFFHAFSRTDLKKIYDDGKIPRLADWPDKIALDDLMTQSALQSFCKDQDALDQRIRSFLK